MFAVSCGKRFTHLSCVFLPHLQAVGQPMAGYLSKKYLVILQVQCTAKAGLLCSIVFFSFHGPRVENSVGADADRVLQPICGKK